MTLPVWDNPHAPDPRPIHYNDCNILSWDAVCDCTADADAVWLLAEARWYAHVFYTAAPWFENDVARYATGHGPEWLYEEVEGYDF